MVSRNSNWRQSKDAGKQSASLWLTCTVGSLTNKDIRISVCCEILVSQLNEMPPCIYHAATTQHLEMWESVVLPCCSLTLFILHRSKPSQCISGKIHQTLAFAITSRDVQARRALDMITESEADGAGKDSSQHQGCFVSLGRKVSDVGWVTRTENFLNTSYTINIYSSAAMRTGSQWKPTIFLFPARA